MSVRSFLRVLLTVLVPAACLSSTYLYLYPLFHNCAFPTSTTPGSPAAFRLLVLADPQLEGDTSLPHPEDSLLPRLKAHWHEIVSAGITTDDFRGAVNGAVTAVWHRDLPDAFNSLRKRIDLFGNDYYLAHIYRTLDWWTTPSHVTVLGDLIGSQWLTDEEFDRRGWRYWNRVFAKARRVEDWITRGDETTVHTLGDKSWRSRVINVAGNHDIGYPGDISEARISRFERVFGNVNWDVRFVDKKAENDSQELPPSIHLVVLNNLNLDTPALSEDLQSSTYDFLNNAIGERSQPVEDRLSFTLLLTHLPLHKRAGVCVDAPYFDFHKSDDNEGRYKAGGLKEQNHLSEHSSRGTILGGIFGMSKNDAAPMRSKGRNGLILTGHDHEGCDVWHFLPQSSMALEGGDHQQGPDWQAMPWKEARIGSAHTGIREITMRSMMGEFGGNAGLLSVWFDGEKREWQHDIQMCKLGVQHLWWFVHVLDIFTIGILFFWTISSLAGQAVVDRGPAPRKVPKAVQNSHRSEKNKREGK